MLVRVRALRPHRRGEGDITWRGGAPPARAGWITSASVARETAGRIPVVTTTTSSGLTRRIDPGRAAAGPSPAVGEDKVVPGVPHR